MTLTPKWTAWQIPVQMKIGIVYPIRKTSFAGFLFRLAPNPLQP